MAIHCDKCGKPIEEATRFQELVVTEFVDKVDKGNGRVVNRGIACGACIESLSQAGGMKRFWYFDDNKQDLSCPFCRASVFDEAQLKHHLKTCEKYAQVIEL